MRCSLSGGSGEVIEVKPQRDGIALLFALESPARHHVPVIEALIARLRAERVWAGSGPEFLNDVDEDSVLRPGDQPIWTLGGVLWLSEPSSGDREAQQFEDVVFLVEELRRFSEAGHPFDVEYNGEEIGSISRGSVDPSLREGLIEPWAARLGR